MHVNITISTNALAEWKQKKKFIFYQLLIVVALKNKGFDLYTCSGWMLKWIHKRENYFGENHFYTLKFLQSPPMIVLIVKCLISKYDIQ